MDKPETQSDIDRKAAEIGISRALAYDLIMRDGVGCDLDNEDIFADTHKRMFFLRKLYSVEPGEVRERVAEQ